jgi:predicted component of type VI protein secretion system
MSMRVQVAILTLCVLLVGCVSAPSGEPREYLDERTGATITTVAQPWIFASRNGHRRQDFVHLYALDVNRMGSHRQYLAVVKYWPAPEHDAVRHVPPTLVLMLDGDPAQFEPAPEAPRDHGLDSPLDPHAPKGTQVWLYPVDAAQFQRIAQAQHVMAAVVAAGIRVDYAMWRDGAAELKAFAAIAGDW